MMEQEFEREEERKRARKKKFSPPWITPKTRYGRWITPKPR